MTLFTHTEHGWRVPEIARNTPGLARRDHPATARAAAASVAGVTGAARTAVYDAIRRAAEGLTDEEIVDATGLGASTVRPRRVELARAGLIVARGERKTRSGRGAQVWYLNRTSRGQSQGGDKDCREGPRPELTFSETDFPTERRGLTAVSLAYEPNVTPHDAAQPGPRATPDADRAAFADGGGA